MRGLCQSVASRESRYWVSLGAIPGSVHCVELAELTSRKVISSCESSSPGLLVVIRFNQPCLLDKWPQLLPLFPEVYEEIRKHENEELRKISHLATFPEKLSFPQETQHSPGTWRLTFFFHCFPVPWPFTVIFDFSLKETESKHYKSKLTFPQVTSRTLVPWGKSWDKEWGGQEFWESTIHFLTLSPSILIPLADQRI